MWANQNQQDMQPSVEEAMMIANPISSSSPEKYRESSSKDNEELMKMGNSPVRPLSAYNFFFKHERRILLDSLPAPPTSKPRRSHGKIGFAEMARVIGARWKAITPERKAVFDRMAAEDKARYKREMKEFKKRGKVSSFQVQRSSPVDSPSADYISTPQSLPLPVGWETRSYQVSPSYMEPAPLDQSFPPAPFPVPAGPMSSDHAEDNFEPFDFNDVRFRDSMAKLAAQLDDQMMDRFIRAFR